MSDKKVYQTVDMCRFCSKEYPECEAQPVFSKEINSPHLKDLDSEKSVIACDRYKSPVEILKKKFH